MMLKLFLLYIGAINMVAFCMMAIDKERARRHEWRIPEGSLLLVAFVGGSIGAYLGMKTFHHKTRKWYFVYGIPSFMILQAILLAFWFISRFVR